MLKLLKLCDIMRCSAADLVTGDKGCGDRKHYSNFGHCPCVNCKYEDHGGTTIIALDA